MLNAWTEQGNETARMRKWLKEKIAAGKKLPFAEIVTLTPALASLLLESNSSNRPISKAGQNEIRQDIEGGRYVLNGESIIVSDTGVLNDGQHRCRTVLETGIAIQTVIVFGPKEATRFTIDTGRSKTVSNFLGMKGHKYSSALGAAIGYVLQIRDLGHIPKGGSVGRPSKQAIIKASDSLRGIDSSVEFTAPCIRTIRSHGVVACCHFMFAHAASREAADYFITKLMEGDDLKKGDPILYCRSRLISLKRGTFASSKFEIMFRCWNASRLGRRVESSLKVTGGILPDLEA